MDPENYLQQENWMSSNNFDLHRPGILECLNLDFVFQIAEIINPERPGEASTSGKMAIKILPHPKTSSLDPPHQQQYLKLIKRFRYTNVLPSCMTPDEKKSFKRYHTLRQLVLCEQMEYQKYAFEQAKENIWLYNYVPNLAEQYVGVWLKRCMKDVNALPSSFGNRVIFSGPIIDLYTLKRMVPIEFKYQGGLKVVGKQRKIGSLKHMDIKMQKIPIKRTMKKARKRLEDDPNIERLLRKWKADVVVSLSSLKVIMQTSEKWEWEIPIKVKSCKHDNEEQDRRVAFIGKPLPPKSLNGRQMNDLYFKALTKILLEEYKYDADSDADEQVNIQQVDGMGDSSSEEEEAAMEVARASPSNTSETLRKWKTSFFEKHPTEPAAQTLTPPLWHNKVKESKSGSDSEFSYCSSDDNLIIDEGPTPPKPPESKQTNKADSKKIASPAVSDDEAATISLTPAPIAMINFDVGNKETEIVDIEKHARSDHQKSVLAQNVASKRHAIPPVLQNKRTLLGSSSFNTHFLTNPSPTASIVLQKVNLQPNSVPSILKTTCSSQPKIQNTSSTLQSTHNTSPSIRSYPLMQNLSPAYQRSQTSTENQSAPYAISQYRTTYSTQSPVVERPSPSIQSSSSEHQRSQTPTNCCAPYTIPQYSAHSTQSPVVERPVEKHTSPSIPLLPNLSPAHQTSTTCTELENATAASGSSMIHSTSISPVIGRPAVAQNMPSNIQNYPLMRNLSPAYSRTLSSLPVQSMPAHSAGRGRVTQTPSGSGIQSSTKIQNRTPAFQRHSVAHILSSPFGTDQICDTTFKSVEAQNHKLSALHHSEAIQNTQVVRSPPSMQNVPSEHHSVARNTSSTPVESLSGSAATTRPGSDILGDILSKIIDPKTRTDKSTDRELQYFCPNEERDPYQFADFEPSKVSDEPIELENLNDNAYAYSLWTLGKVNILIRSKCHGTMKLRGPNKLLRHRNCVVRSKVEYQSTVGYEKLTNYEACSDWLDMTVRPKPTAIVRLHICAATHELISKVEVYKLTVPETSKSGEFHPALATHRLSEILNWLVQKVTPVSKISNVLLSRSNYQGQVMLKFSTQDVPATQKDPAYNVQQHYANPGRFIKSTAVAFPHAQLNPERQVPRMSPQIPLTFEWVTKKNNKKKKNKNKKFDKHNRC